MESQYSDCGCVIMVQSFNEFGWSPGVLVNIHEGAASPQEDRNSVGFSCHEKRSVQRARRGRINEQNYCAL